jgi:hypothetical protein
MSDLHEICIVSRLTPFLERDLGNITILSFAGAGTNAAAHLVILTCDYTITENGNKRRSERFLISTVFTLPNGTYYILSSPLWFATHQMTRGHDAIS